MNVHCFLIAGCAIMLPVTQAHAIVLFSDDLNTVASQSNYTPVTVGQTSVTYAFDYGP